MDRQDSAAGVQREAVDRFAAGLGEAESKVLQIRVIRRLGDGPLRRLPHRLRLTLALAIASSPPALLGAACTLLGDPSSTFVWAVIACYGLLTALAYAFAQQTWRLLVTTSSKLATLVDEASVLETLHGEAVKRARPGPQVAMVLLGACGGLASAVAVSAAIGSDADFRPVYLFAIAWTGAIGLLTVYWIGSAGRLFANLRLVARPRLDWIAPANTPGLEMTRHLITVSSTRASIGLFLFAVPIGLTLGIEPHSPGVLIPAGLGLAVSVSSVLWAVIVPRFWLRRLERHGRATLLETLRAQIPDTSQLATLTAGDLPAAAVAYQQLRDTSPPGIGWGSLLMMVVQTVTALLPYLAGPASILA